ncbi:MAG: HDIG domain-containing metalloprotein [Syntrophobacteraceae bacterium]|jgi:putative nucleotidyltransferase with HDIG domain
MEREKREPEKGRGKSWLKRMAKLIPFDLKNLYCRKWLLVAALSLAISTLVSPSFIVENPKYRLGDIADRNVKAKHDFLVEDEEATTKKREEAVRQAPIVYDLDERIITSLTEKLDASFKVMRDAQIGLESESVREAPSQQSLESIANKQPAKSEAGLGKASTFFPNDSERLLGKKKDFEDFLGCSLTGDIFKCLVEQQFSLEVQEKIQNLIKTTMGRGIVSSKAWDHNEQSKNFLVRKLETGDEILLPPPFPYPDLDEARKMIVMQALGAGRDVRELMLISTVVSSLLQPNLTFNLEATEKKREEAYASVKPVFIKIARNEMLVREGQSIAREELLKLRFHLKNLSDKSWLFVFLAIFTFSAVCIGVVGHVTKQSLPHLRMDVRDGLFLGTLLIFLLLLSRAGIWIGDSVADGSGIISPKTFVYAVPLSAGAMIACIFFGVTVSLIFSLVVTLFSGLIFGKEYALFFYFMIGAFVSAHGVSECRTRMVPIKAGLIVGFTNVILIVLSAFLQEQLVFLKVLTDAFFGLSGGIFAGILATGLTPLAEMVFGYTTDIKLLELATMDQPLLRELMVEAPGTYHHSIIVGNMVEAAAKFIGANSLLAKVAAYYHDIGKIRKPLYFIENQFECENRHEKLAPSMSSLILISHVKDGMELARQHHLGKEIINIISQHHGKSFISFFYTKALDAREKNQSVKATPLPPINADDYRYPGPKPQTKEAGLVMLADVVEAACRSLQEPTPARIQGLVNKLINGQFSDGQLDECELTLKDLHQIAKHFNQILATIHHKRIEYPLPNGKAKTDAPDPGREPKQDKDKAGGNKEHGKTDLKRLGIH